MLFPPRNQPRPNHIEILAIEVPIPVYYATVEIFTTWRWKPRSATLDSSELAAVLTWLLGGLPAETLARVRSIAWALAICFVAVTALRWRYAFTTPIVFSTLVTVCLIAAAWLSTKTTRALDGRREVGSWAVCRPT